MKYTEDHEWVADSADGTRQVGITGYAIESLGDIVYVELPDVGQKVAKGDTIANIESVKAASDIYAPVSGEIVAINDELQDAPDLLNEQGSSVWLFAIQPFDESELDSLLDEEGYQALIDAS